MSNQCAVYGRVPDGLMDVPSDCLQTSPRVPGATVLTDIDPGSIDEMIMYAPENTRERRYMLAHALLALKADGRLYTLAPNNKGGTRLAKDLAAFGCDVDVGHRRHHRMAQCARPANLLNIDIALEEGAPRQEPGLGLWTQPGLFSWNRIDPGSALLLRHLPPLSGRGADFGCGYGLLARSVLEKGGCSELTLIDIDRRSLDMAARNVPGDRIKTLWADIRTHGQIPYDLDFVVMNPPFHDGGAEDRALGRAFIEKAAAVLRPGGALWMTSNRHLPYEDPLKAMFTNVEQVAQERGYKIHMAQK